MLEADICVSRRDFPVAVAFTVKEGERVAFFGPSGSGKTTILETVAGLTTPDAGHVKLAGTGLVRSCQPKDRGGRAVRSVPSWQRRVALLRQEPALFPHLDVRANLRYAHPRADPAKLQQLVHTLELDALLHARPDALSGGQRQRVALGRALLSDFAVLLLDEPYTGLDSRLRHQLTNLIRAETATRGVPAVLVAHELVEAQAFADRLGVLDRGQLLQFDTPGEIVRNPLTRRVAELVGYRSFLPVPGPAARALPPGAVIAVHPERVQPGIHPALGVPLAGALLSIRAAGAGFDVDLGVGGTPVRCRMQEAPPQGPDAVEVTVLTPPIFAADGTRCQLQQARL